MRLISFFVALALTFGVAPIVRGATEPPAETPEFTGEILVKGSFADVVAAGLIPIREVGLGWTLAKPKGIALASAASEVAERITEDFGLLAEPDIVYPLAAEPLFDEQWGMENTGQDGGTPDADIDVLDAWGVSKGAPRVRLAVLDTGADLDHPDLKSVLWTNTGEVPGNGIDDDGNGYVDDVRGWDAIDHDAVPEDTHGHGTLVASVAAGDLNGVGVAGVAPNVSVMPIRVCGDGDTGCPGSAILTGIDYAIANGADVANMSFGGDGTSPAFEQAIRAAVDAGILVVAAAGNYATDNDLEPIYPANFDIDGVISVAATDRNDQLASFSNYGDKTVDLGAPGKEIVGAVPGGWASASGTSFAAPMVSGAAALLKTFRPDATPVEIKKLLLGHVDDVAGLAGKTITGGRLNIGSSMAVNAPPVANATFTPSLGEAPLVVQASAEKSTDYDGSIVKRVWRTSSGSFTGEKVKLSFVSTGAHDVTLELTDNDGAKSTTRYTVLVGTDFEDTEDSVFHDAITWLSAHGITAGCNPPANDEFCPEGRVTRGQMAAFFVRAFGYTDDGGGDLFVDDDGSVFETAIDRLATAGVTVGCNPPANDRFCPDDLVTRGQMAAFFGRALGYTDDGGGDLFVDDDGSVFEKAIDRLATAGVTVGCNPPANDRYCPNDFVNRGQMAAFFKRALGA